MILVEHRVHQDFFLPIILFLVLGCGLFVEWRVDQTPLATNGSRGERRAVQGEVLSS